MEPLKLTTRVKYENGTVKFPWVLITNYQYFDELGNVVNWLKARKRVKDTFSKQED